MSAPVAVRVVPVRMGGLPPGREVWSYELRSARSGRLVYASAGNPDGYRSSREHAESAARHLAAACGREVAS